MKEQTDEIKISLIQKDISYIQTDISDIKTVLKEGYATKDSLIEVAKDTEKRLTKLEASRNLWMWLSPTLSAVVGSIMTFLIIQYLINFS